MPRQRVKNINWKMIYDVIPRSVEANASYGAR